MIDYLATFKDTLSVMQAEQALIRRKVPFETVPHSQYNRNGCGLAILFSEEYLGIFQKTIEENDIKSHLKEIFDTIPSEKNNKKLTM